MKRLTKLYNYLKNKWENLINLKFIRCIFNFLPHNFFIFLFFIVSITTLFNFNTYNNTDYVSVYKIIELDSTIGPIIDKTKIDLSAIETTEEFSSICFRVGTYARNNTIDLTLEVINNNKKILNSTINTSTLTDGGNACFDTNGLSLNDLKESEVSLIPSENVTANNTITIYQDQDKNLALSLIKNQDEELKIFINFAFVIFIIIYLLINHFINKYEINIKNFLLLMLCYIIPILLIIPAYQVPDEVAHFYRAYHLSQYNSSDGIYNGFFNEEIEVPSNIKCLNYSKVQKADKVLNFNDIKKCLATSENIKMKDPSVGNSSLLGYLIQALAIKFIDIFTNSPMIIFYFGRLITFSASFFIAYLAIKITPRYKSLFLIVATMMMFIQQLISYSYDSILNSISLLYVAYILKLVYEKKKITYKDWLLLIVMLLFLTSIKRLVYLPLFSLLFLIPKDKFKNNKNKLILIILALILVFILYKGLNEIINIGRTISENPIETKEYTSTDQLRYLFSNPLNILNVAIETIKTKGMFYLNGLVGYFGWFTFRISNKYILFYLLLFLYAILGESSKFKIKNKILPFIGILISIGIIFGAMYIYWSDYMLPYVEGVQGRYFIPLLIPFAILCIPRKKKYKIDNKVIFGSINILLLQYVLTLVLWYY